MTITSRSPSRFASLVVLLIAASFAPNGSAARAERLLFQRGDALYAAGTDGKDARRLFVVGPAAEDVVWAPAPDGHRVAWLERLPVRAEPSGAAGLGARPVAVYVADLSGRHRKRLLATNDLRDRQGRRVSALFVGRDVAGTPEGVSSLREWALDALAWSADGRSLYLSCTFLSEKGGGGRATFVADAQTGTPVVDAQGRWKSIAPMTQVDVRGPLLVGVGLARTTDAAAATPGAVSSAAAQTRYAPLLVTNLAEGKTTSLLPPAFSSARRPAYATALSPALSPDTSAVVFTALGQGLYLVDVPLGKSYRRLTTGPGDDNARWLGDGKRILYLSASPDGAADDLYDLEVPLVGTGRGQLVLANVARFFVVPD